MAVLVDTNILVYRFDDRFAEKQKIATEILRRGIIDDSARLPHQGMVEFVAADSRLYDPQTSRRSARSGRIPETVHGPYPNEAILRDAVRGCAAYQLTWDKSPRADAWGLPGSSSPKRQRGDS